MKKITLILSAVLFALSLYAAPLPKKSAVQLNQALRTIDKSISFSQDKQDNAKKVAAAVAEEEVWVSKGDVEYTDDIVLPFFSYDPDVYTVELQELEGKEGYFRLVDPIAVIGNDFGITSGDPVYWVFDATDPDAVKATNLQSNTTFGSNGALYIEWLGTTGTYKDGEITFPYRAFAVGFDGSANWYANTNTKFKISIPNNDAHPESVTLNAESIELAAGLEAQLKPTISPSTTPFKDVTWSSADPTIATVDEDGYVLGVAPGKTTVTVTTVDGGKTATAEVIVDDFTAIGSGKFVDGFLTTYTVDTETPYHNDNVTIEESNERPGFYRVLNPYATEDTLLVGNDATHYFYIDAQDPDFVSVPLITLPIAIKDSGWCNITVGNYTEYFGTDREEYYIDYFGKIERNVITFPQPRTGLLVAGVNAACGVFYANYDGTFSLTIPDIIAPKINTVELYAANTTSATLRLEIEENVTLDSELLFNVKNGSEDLKAGLKLNEEGLLVIDGLTANTTYSLILTATDEAGNTSTPTEALAVTTPATDDNVAPVIEKADITTLEAKKVVITLTVTEEVTSAEDLIYEVSINDGREFEGKGTVIEFTATSKTPYTVTIVVRDEAGNKSEAKEVEVTTPDLTPTELTFTNYDARYINTSGGKYIWQVRLWTNGKWPMLSLAILSNKLNAISGEYNATDLNNLYMDGVFRASYLDPENGDSTAVYEYADNAEVKIEFKGYDQSVRASARLGIYKITFKIWTENDEALYVGTFDGTSYLYTYSGNNVIEMKDELDDVAPDTEIDPELDINNLTETSVDISVWALEGESEAEQLNTYGQITVKILNAADDSEMATCEPLETSITDTNDAIYGATLTGLTPGTTYTVYGVGIDAAGNVTARSDKNTVSFTTKSKATGLDELQLNQDIQKILKEGHVYILKDNKQFNVLGTQVK